jgi:hypothetical protein
MHEHAHDANGPGEHYALASDMSFDDRAKARAFLETLGGSILSKERARRPGEGPEPDESVA